MRIFAIVWLVLFLTVLPLGAADAGVGDAIVFRAAWGNARDQVGIRFPEKDVLPLTSGMGPGGFRVDDQGGVWIADSLQKAVKRFGPQGAVEVFPVAAARLGDLDLQETTIAVCTVSPHGVLFLDRKDGRTVASVALEFPPAGRLLALRPDRLAVEESPDGQLWTVLEGRPERHPAAVLGAVGDDARLLGVAYEFASDSRNLVGAGWTPETSEPRLFSVLRRPGERIVFCRWVGIRRGIPVLQVLTADSPGQFHLLVVGGDGVATESRRISVFDAPAMASPWVVGRDGFLYGIKGDGKGFSIRRFALP